MELRSALPPFVRTEESVPGMLGTTVFALCALLVIPTVRFGPRPLVMAAASVLTGLLCQLLFELLQGRVPSVGELSFAVTGLVTAMLVPVNAPVWLPCAACAFGILAVKMPFGGFGRSPFNPAAAGIAFAAVCWPKLMFSYLDASEPFSLPPFADASCRFAQSPAAVLKSGLKPDILPKDLLWGTATGPLGTTAVLVIGACALLLFVRRAARWETTACFLGTCALLAAFFPRIACSPLTSVKYELLTGALLFCAVFMVTDPVTSPRTFPARCLYGALAGAMAMVFRHFGAYQEGVFFAVLIANAAAPVLESAVCRLRGWEGKPHGQ